jgi:hypothetical protein
VITYLNARDGWNVMRKKGNLYRVAAKNKYCQGHKEDIVQWDESLRWLM